MPQLVPVFSCLVDFVGAADFNNDVTRMNDVSLLAFRDFSCILIFVAAADPNNDDEFEYFVGFASF